MILVGILQSSRQVSICDLASIVVKGQIIDAGNEDFRICASLTFNKVVNHLQIRSMEKSRFLASAIPLN